VIVLEVRIMGNSGLTEEQVRGLRKNGMLYVDNELLQNIKRHYKQGRMGICIFDPPEVGTDIILLEHYVSSRDNINTRFRTEDGFDKEWVIYHVEEPKIYDGMERSPKTRAVLSYKIMNGPVRERVIDYRDFYCGFYCAVKLTEDGLETAKRFREELNEDFCIRT